MTRSTRAALLLGFSVGLLLTPTARADPPPPERATALAYLADARARAAGPVPEPLLCRIDMAGVPPEGTIDLTAEPSGQSIQYGFTNGRLGCLVSYTQATGQAEPFVLVLEWDPQGSLPFPDEVLRRLPDSDAVTPVAVEERLPPPYYIAYQVDPEGRPVIDVAASDGRLARFDALTGDVLRIAAPPRPSDRPGRRP